MANLTQQNTGWNHWNDPFVALRRMMEPSLRGQGGTPSDSVVGQYPVDIQEDGENLYVQAELPGFTREQVSVTIDDGVLTIRAERDESSDDRKPLLNERRFTRAQRSFVLPTEVEDAKVEAKLQDGVLHLTLPKREEARRRQIQVQ